MIIKILGAESLGVRGLSCLVELNGRKIFIDPGIALGWTRYGFLPHPLQIAIGAAIRKIIIKELKNASDVIISHFDGDHCPLYDPNPYQLGITNVKNSLSDCRIWAKGPENCSPIERKRREELLKTTGEAAWKNAMELSKNVGTLIIDHHLLRSAEGIKWLEKLKCHAKNKVCCAADFMEREPVFLEAWREELYEWLPVSENWHEDYKQGKVNADHYRIRGRELLIGNRKQKNPIDKIKLQLIKS